MQIQYTAQALELGWATEGEEVTAKELREAAQDRILENLIHSLRVQVNEDPVGKFEGSPEFAEELNKQINRIGKLFNYDNNVIR
tara:strand:- start:280 stop:531 length:252 start_codon:yes stop_codon:yes gene_type:complete